MIGVDETSKGGIASVVRTYVDEHRRNSNGIELRTLKTSHYKDKGLPFEVLILAKSLLIYIYLMFTYRPQILHIHSSAYVSFYRKSIFVLIGRIFRKTIIIHLHASAFDEFFLSDSKLVHSYAKWILKMATRVIALCTDWQRKLEEGLQLDNVIVLPNPVVLDGQDIQREFLSSGKLQVLFLGFLIKSKGLADIIEVAKVIKQEGNAVQISICGKGELEQYLKDAIRDHNLEDIVFFRGWVESGTKDSALINADVFFLPSYNEGMPISILEAMKFGLPIVSTRIAGIPDIVTNEVNGYLFMPGDTSGFHLALKELANDKSLLHAMGNASSKKVKNFGGSVIWDQLSIIYGKLQKA